MWISPNDEACEVDRGSMEPPPRDFGWAFLNPAAAGIPLLLLEADEDFVEAVFFPWGCDILSRARARLVLTGINAENARPDCQLKTQQRGEASKKTKFYSGVCTRVNKFCIFSLSNSYIQDLRFWRVAIQCKRRT